MSTPAVPADRAAILARLERRLARLYGAERAPGLCAQVVAVTQRHAAALAARPARTRGWSAGDALLITYGNSITAPGEAPLRTLHRFLREQVGARLSFVHLLPFYPYTSDDGFSVSDFRAVRPELGTWDDVHALAQDYRVVADGVINHVSQESAYVRGFCAGDPQYADFCVSLDPKTDTSSVLRTRNLPLLHDYPTSTGTQWLWTTFSRDQVDLNYHNPLVLLEILDVLLGYAAHGSGMIRLDAIPYLWKQLGTSCAHLPETHELIKLIRDVCDLAAPDVLLLAECNVPQAQNLTYLGEDGDEAQMIYNFCLPPLILHALVRGTAVHLTTWAAALPTLPPRATWLNVTATHDGIGMRPTEGLLNEDERKFLCELATRHQGAVTGKRNADGSVSPYELNLNYFDAVNDPTSSEGLEVQLARFLLSQALPLCLPGVPGIYVHSLLGSRNDLAGVQRSGKPRSINRAELPLAEITAALADPTSLRARVFRAYTRLLAVRAAQPAFAPGAPAQVLDLHPALFAVRRTPATGAPLVALHHVGATPLRLPLARLGLGAALRDLLATGGDQGRTSGGELILAPYQVCWLVPQ